MRIESFDGEKVFLIHDFLTPAECTAAIARAESIGFGDAPVIMDGYAVVNKGIRNNERVMLDDPTWAAALWQRAKPYIPARVGPSSAIALNERLRFYRYDPGQRFQLHSDGAFHRNEREVSRLTLIIYLNDSFTGGDTVFFEGWEKWCDERFRVRPIAGAALVFAHELLHEGAPVTSGRKYVLRSDVMYAWDEPITTATN